MSCFEKPENIEFIFIGRNEHMLEHACMSIKSICITALSDHSVALIPLVDMTSDSLTDPLRGNPMEKGLLCSPLTGSGRSDIESVLSNSLVSVWIKTGGPVTSSCSWPHSQMSGHSLQRPSL